MAKGNLFGIESSYEGSKLVLIPVPWEATTSYGAGTSNGPRALLNASDQIDLLDPHFGDISTHGIHWSDHDYNTIKGLNTEAKLIAQKLIANFDETGDQPPADNPGLLAVNDASKAVTGTVYGRSQKIIEAGKVPAVVGGDHSSPLGLIQALGESHGSFSILHIDAHADLRHAYQGFEQSHASIMWNAVNNIPQLDKIVSVGIRDYCREEFELAKHNPKVSTFYNADVKESLYKGQTWAQVCEEILGQLGDKVYISFDIDGLSPEFCPNTGTPVPGGLSFDQASFLLAQIPRLKKQVIGFDLCEVAPGETSELDANIGMRMLYKLCGCALSSQ